MASMPPIQLGCLLSENVLTALMTGLEPLIARLASNSRVACAWASIERLAMLPRASRRVLCGALAMHLDEIDAETAAAVASALM